MIPSEQKGFYIMTYEEMQEAMSFIVEQQKGFAERLTQLAEQEARNKADAAARFALLEQTVTTVVKTVQALVAVVESHEERMDNFVRTIERYVQARGNNGSGA